MAISFDGSGDRITRNVSNFGQGWSGYTVVSWIQSNVTNNDQGWFNLSNPTGSDRFGGVRYDASGASGGGTNLMKFGLFINGSERVVECANNTQTTDVQLVVGRWQDGANLEIWLDGAFSPPTFVQDGNGTLNGYSKIVLGAGPKEGGSGAWDGIVFQHRVYSRRLSGGEIESIFATRGADAIYDGLALFYACSELAPGAAVPGGTGFVRDLSAARLDLSLESGNPVYAESFLRERRVA